MVGDLLPVVPFAAQPPSDRRRWMLSDAKHFLLQHIPVKRKRILKEKLQKRPRQIIPYQMQRTIVHMRFGEYGRCRKVYHTGAEIAKYLQLKEKTVLMLCQRYRKAGCKLNERGYSKVHLRKVFFTQAQLEELLHPE